MKKVLSMMMALGLVLALAGCGGGSGGSGSNEGYPDKDGYAEGRMGTVMHNEFFDFTVNSAYLCDTFGGYTPEAGNELLVADMTIKNTFSESIPMFDTDFQAQWGDDADDAFSMPVYPPINDEQLPDEYDLAVDEEASGLLVFEVPAGNKDFSISYMEEFEDETTGDSFFVYFTAEKEAAAV